MKEEAESQIAAIVAEAEDFAAKGAGDVPSKPRVRVDRINPDQTVAALRDALARCPQLFERGVPVRLIDDPEQGLAARPHTPDSLVLLAHQTCRPYVSRRTKDGAWEEVDAALPRGMTVSYLDWHGERRLPPLNGVVSTPILRADGTFHSKPGYDSETGFFLVGVPDVSRLVPIRPTRTEAERALRLLRQRFATFCFADAATTRIPDVSEPVLDLDVPPGDDESAFLVAVLTGICRPSLPLAPGILLRAASMSGAGSGKGLLARCISLIAFGREPFAVTAGPGAEELEKRIGAELIAGGPTILLDNLNDRAVKSDLLASIITERPTRIRLLGKSEMVTLNPSALVMLTGNGLSVSEDLARRFIVIELDSKTEDPEARRFQGNLLEEVGRERAALLSAGLTIWRWGRQQEGLQAGLPLGNFEPWSSWVRDPLLELGCRDPVRRVAEVKQRDVRRQELAAALELWQQHHGARPMTANTLHDAVKAALDPQGRGRQYLARKLETLANTRMGGMVLTRQQSGKWSAATYALLPVGEAEGHRGHRGHRERDLDGAASDES